jgi:hypothetical protein
VIFPLPLIFSPTPTRQDSRLRPINRRRQIFFICGGFGDRKVGGKRENAKGGR